MDGLGKHILAAYYNDARLNILTSLNHIRASLNLPDKDNEDLILNAYQELRLLEREPELQADLIKKLRSHFRFLDPLTDQRTDSRIQREALSKNNNNDKALESDTATPALYEAKMLWMLKQVNVFRNAFVHPTLIDNSEIEEILHKRTYHDLYSIYDSALTTVKERFSLEEYLVKPLRSWDPKQQIVVENGKTRKINKRKALNQFSLAITIDPKSKNNQPLITNSFLYDFGHVLFCSLLLNRHQSAELLAYFWRSKHGKGWSQQQREIIQEVVGVYRVHPPLQRLKSDHSEHALTLDSLSELSRCPRRLFDVISPVDQEKFRIPLSEGVELEPEAVMDKENPLTVLYARGNDDRFVSLMMRYLDFDSTSKLRFGIDLGQLYYNVRIKPADKFTDEICRVRRLSQKIIAYGRLNQFLDAEPPEQWQVLEENASASPSEAEDAKNAGVIEIQHLKPYWVRCNPHYHYFHDKIGLRIVDKNSAATESGFPEIQGEPTTPAALVPPKASDMEPEFWISPSQMMQLTFYHYLQSQRTDQQYLSVDIVLSQYRRGMKSLIKALRDNPPALQGNSGGHERRNEAQAWVDSFFSHQNNTKFSVPLADLPKVINQFLLGKEGQSVSKEELVARCNHLINETKKKLTQIQFQISGAKKRGKKGFSAIKCGHIGDFLADDLMRFQTIDPSKSDGGKLNSQEYQILQASLAYYGAHIHEPPRIVDLLDDCGLLNGDFAHPFLGKLQLTQNPEKYGGLLSFYQDYLIYRERFIQGFVSRVFRQGMPEKLPGWLRLRQRSSLTSWLNEQSSKEKQPLHVPKKLLNSPILGMVADAIGSNAERLKLEGGQVIDTEKGSVTLAPNINWLIKQYLQHQDDTAQAMYVYPRRHDVFDNLNDKRSGRTLFQVRGKHYLSEQERQTLLPDVREAIAIQDKQSKQTPPGRRNNKAVTKQVKEAAAKKEKLTKQLQAYKRQERVLRQTSYQDRLLFLYTKQQLTELQLAEGTEPPNWSLHDIERTLLKTPIQYRLGIPETDKQLMHPDCKVRNLPEVRLLARDRRLKTLVAYYPEEQKVLSQYEVRAELNSYGRMRVKTMAMIHCLEKKIFKKLNYPCQSHEQFI